MEPTWPTVEAGFSAYLITHRRKPSTARTYTRNVALFARWGEPRGVAPAAATKEHISAYLSSLINSRLAHNTAPLRLSCLRAFYKYCRDAGWRQDDPTEGHAIKWIEPPPKAPYSKQELVALLDACRSPRDRAMILLGYNCGLRVSEVVGLRSHNIDTERRSVYVVGKGDKGAWLPIDEETLDALRPFMRQPKGIMWWTRQRDEMTVKRAQRAMEQIAGRAGVEHVHWHRLRTTFANEAIDQGVPIENLQELMRHSQISTTIRYARHTINRRAHEQARGLHLVGALLALERV